MANNYTQFSGTLQTGTSEEEVRWIESQLHIAVEDGAIGARIDNAESDGDEEVWAEIRKELGYEWDVPGICLQTETPGFSHEYDAAGELVICTEESGNVDAVAAFVQAYLRRWAPGCCFALTFADVCDKPRTGEFGGGAIFVTKDAVEAWSAHAWVREKYELLNATGASSSGRKVTIGDNETLVVGLPDGREVSILLGNLEPGEQLPELDIMLPEAMTLNCFLAGLVPSPARGNTVTARQIIIPLSGPASGEKPPEKDGYR